MVLPICPKHVIHLLFVPMDSVIHLLSYMSKTCNSIHSDSSVLQVRSHCSCFGLKDHSSVQVCDHFAYFSKWLTLGIGHYVLWWYVVLFCCKKGLVNGLYYYGIVIWITSTDLWFRAIYLVVDIGAFFLFEFKKGCSADLYWLELAGCRLASWLFQQPQPSPAQRNLSSGTGCLVV